jgi:hypothetical protein
VDQYTAIPGHDQIAAMCAGLIYSFLVGDHITATRITMEIEDMGVSAADLASSMGVVAAGMLVSGTGSRAKARSVAARTTEHITRTEAGAAAARRAAA